jgi:hypothetical protein
LDPDGRFNSTISFILYMHIRPQVPHRGEFPIHPLSKQEAASE